MQPGVARDEFLAVEYYLKAAAQGEALAEYRLGRCHELGIGMEPNQVRATAWYEKAAAKGNADALEALQSQRKQ